MNTGDVHKIRLDSGQVILGRITEIRHDLVWAVRVSQEGGVYERTNRGPDPEGNDVIVVNTYLHIVPARQVRKRQVFSRFYGQFLDHDDPDASKT